MTSLLSSFSHFNSARGKLTAYLEQTKNKEEYAENVAEFVGNGLLSLLSYTKDMKDLEEKEVNMLVDIFFGSQFKTYVVKQFFSDYVLEKKD